MKRKYLNYCFISLTVLSLIIVISYWPLLRNYKLRISAPAILPGEDRKDIYTDLVTSYQAPKMRSLQQLGTLIQRRIHYLQNPKNCTTAKKLLCYMGGCGLGCTVHRAIVCFYTAYALKRTLIFYNSALNDKSKDIFKPLSETCDINNITDVTSISLYDPTKAWLNFTTVNNSIRVLTMTGGRIIKWPMSPYMPGTLPQDIAEELKQQHTNPTAWFSGQFVLYLVGRFTTNFHNMLENVKRNIGFKNPIVGVHIRSHARYHNAVKPDKKVFIDSIENAFEKLPKVKEKRIFFTGDEPNDLDELQRRFPQYHYVYVEGSVVDALEYHKGKYKNDSFVNLFLDWVLLSQTDYFIGTLTSNIDRMVYEYKQAVNNLDLTDCARSLDRPYHNNWFGSEELDIRPKYFLAIENHTAAFEEMNFQKGEFILSDEILNLRWEEFKQTMVYATGTSQLTGKRGKFPVEKVIPFPGDPLYATFEEHETLDES